MGEEHDEERKGRRRTLRERPHGQNVMGTQQFLFRGGGGVVRASTITSTTTPTRLGPMIGVG